MSTHPPVEILSPSLENIKKAASLLQQDKLVAFPTETVYGLGANALSELAIKKIYAAKNRPATNPLIVHIADASEVENIAVLPVDTAQRKIVSRLMELWPAPLTLVFEKKTHVPDSATAHSNTVAVRIPNHELARTLIREAQLPIAAPSANIANNVSPTTAQHVRDENLAGLSMILNGGDCTHGLESTVVSLIDGKPTILRPGAFTKEMLEKHLGCTVYQGTGNASPGQGAKHYSPQTPLVYYTNFITGNYPSNAVLGRIRFRPHKEGSRDDTRFALDICLSNQGDLTEVAQRLFAAIRDADQMGLDLIIIDDCERKHLGSAIMDRLDRATLS